jgi:hypothetical protein
MKPTYATPQEAIKKAIKIWEVIASPEVRETIPQMHKLAAYVHLELPETDLHDCPCCQFAEEESKETNKLLCECCPVKDWGNGEISCCRQGSAYNAWCIASYENDLAESAAVVEVLKAALATYEKGEPDNE